MKKNKKENEMANFIQLTSSTEFLIDIRTGVQKSCKILVNIDHIKHVCENDDNGSKIWVDSKMQDPIRVFEPIEEIITAIANKKIS